MSDALGFAIDVRVEERLRDDRKRKPHHLGVDVALFTALPFARQAGCVAHHRVGVTRDPAAVKRGLGEPPLPQPEVAFARQQSVAKELLVLSEDAAFDEFPIVGDEHLLDVVRMADEEDAKVVVAHRDDVAVVALQRRHEGKRVATINLEACRPRFGRRSGRQFGWGGGAHDSTIPRPGFRPFAHHLPETQFYLVALKRNPPERESSLTRENPTAERRSTISARSIGTKTLPM